MRISRPAAAVLSLFAAAVQAAPSTSALPTRPGVYVNPSPAPLADFALTDHEGRSRSFSSLRGEPLLVFFGFTRCPQVCPDALARLKLLHESNDGALEAARVVLISVDGERDTPAAMQRFLRPVSDSFIGLTGDPKATAKIAAQFSAVFFKEPAGKDGNYNVMHSAQVFAVDRKGRLRASFVNASIEDMATITSLLIAEPG
jgi:protein SCO1